MANEIDLNELRKEQSGNLRAARRVVIKAGTSVVSTPEGYPSLVRLANIVEQVSSMHQDCKVIHIAHAWVLTLYVYASWIYMPK